MREIKFRAWDEEKKEMFYDEFFVDSDGSPYWHSTQSDANVELMQYTGLKDKNGEEIYEFDYLGDYCVFWGSGKYILQNISTGDIMDCNEKNTQQKEVTGNRFETPREHTAMATDL